MKLPPLLHSHTWFTIHSCSYISYIIYKILLAACWCWLLHVQAAGPRSFTSHAKFKTHHNKNSLLLDKITASRGSQSKMLLVRKGLSNEQATQHIDMHFQFSVHKYPACIQVYFKGWCSALAALEASICIALCSGDSLEHGKNSLKIRRAPASKDSHDCVFTSPVTGLHDLPNLQSMQSCTVRKAIIALDPMNAISGTLMIQSHASDRQHFPSAQQVIFGQTSQNKNEQSTKEEAEAVSSPLGQQAFTRWFLMCTKDEDNHSTTLHNAFYLF